MQRGRLRPLWMTISGALPLSCRRIIADRGGRRGDRILAWILLLRWMVGRTGARDTLDVMDRPTGMDRPGGAP